MFKLLKMTFLLLLLSYPFSPVWAFVVQDAGKALSFNNVARTIAPVVLPAEESYAEESYTEFFSGDSKIDYDKISNKLILKYPEEFYIDLSKNSTQNIRMPVQKSFHLVLPEIQDSRWEIDCNEDVLYPVSSRLEEGVRIIEFEAVKNGNARIFLDNIHEEKGCKKVLQSRIVRVKVIK